MAKNFRADLLAACSITIGKKETEEALALRVAEYISEKLPEDSYNALPKEAQTWYEKAVKALEAEKLIPNLPAPEAAAPAAPAKKAAAKEAAAPAAPAKKAAAKEAAAPAPAGKKAAAKEAAAPAPAAKKAAKKEEPEEPSEPRFSVSDFVKVLVCKNPKLTKEQIKAKVDEGGHELAEAQLKNVYAQTQRTIAILVELGWAKGAKA